MIQSVLPLFLVSSLGASVLTVGLIEGVAESTASVLKLVSGALSDRIGRRKELAIAGYGLSAIVAPLFALASSAGWVFLARFLDRVGKGIRVAPRNALVADVTKPANRGAAYGLRQSLDTIGAFSGPLMATGILLASGQNYRLVFWLATLPGLFSVLLLIQGIREPAVSHRTKKNHFEWNLIFSLGKGYWLLVAVSLLFNLGNFSDAFLLLRAQQIGIGSAFVPLSLVVMNFSYSVSAYPIGRLSDRLGRVGLLAGSFWLFALVYLGFAFAQTPWQIWGLFILYGLYLGMSQGLLLALVADRVPSNLRGTAFGTINFVTGLVLLLASILAAFLWQQISPQAAFVTGSCLAIAAGIVLLNLNKQW